MKKNKKITIIFEAINITKQIFFYFLSLIIIIKTLKNIVSKIRNIIMVY